MSKRNYYFSFLLLGICAIFFQTVNAQKVGRAGMRFQSYSPQVKEVSLLNVSQQADAIQAEKVVILTEDFSKFTAGSEAVPDELEISDPNTDIIHASYTQSPGWTGAGVYQAGGTCYLDQYYYNEDWYTGIIITPAIRIPVGITAYKIKVKARASLSSNTLVVGSYRVGQAFYDNSTEISLSETWQEFEITFTNVFDENIYIEFYPKNSTCYLDDIEVFYEKTVYDGEIPAPVVKYPTNIGENTFTANWEAVPGITTYLLNVYSYENEERSYLLENEEVIGTSCKLERVPGDIQYYYTVRATDGEKVSPESEEMKVAEPEPTPEPDSPNLLPITNLTQGHNTISFTANWEALSDINKYFLYIIETYTADKDETFVVAHEDFSKITDGTKENPIEGDMIEELDRYTNLPGWIALFPYYAKGMVGLAGGGTSEIDSPFYDLSAGDGKFSVEITALSGPGNNLIIGKACDLQPAAENSERKALTFTQETETFQTEFTHFNKNASGGIVLRITSETYNMFVDEIKITKELAAGDSLSYITEYEVNNTGNNSTLSQYVEVATKPGYTYSLAVMVMKTGQAGWPGNIGFYGFDVRMPLDLPLPLSITENKVADSAKSYIMNGNLHVVLEQPSAIDVYTISGVLIESIQGIEGENTISLTEKGIYIVKAGDFVTKIVR